MNGSREIKAVAPALPESLSDRTRRREWRRNVVGEAGAAVFRLCAAGAADLYLKHGDGEVAQDVVDEMTRLRWLQGRLAVPQIAHFVADGTGAWLLTEAMPGMTAYQAIEADPSRASAIGMELGRFLKRLHQLPTAECPFNSDYPLRLAHAQRRMAANEVDLEDFGEAHRGWSAERLWDHMQGLLPTVPDPVVTHGDFSLDNILLVDGRVSGCIDLGRAGVADRYQDIAILWDSLGEFGPGAQAAFQAAYGVDAIDRRKIDFHLCLDEFF